MTDAPLSWVTSGDGNDWTEPRNVVNGYTDYGLQMAVYRGELYGIMTQTVQYPKYLFATKFKIGLGWKQPWRGLPSKFLAQGRTSVAVLNDRFFIVRRGTNNAVYLCWTDNFSDFVDCGRVGSQYAETWASPAMASYDGKLFIAGVGKDKYIYITTCDETGERLTSWTKVEGTGTLSSPSMAVLSGTLYLFHTGHNNDAIFYQSLTPKGWSRLQKFSTSITSGTSAVAWKYDNIAVSFRGRDNDVKYAFFDGHKFGPKNYLTDVYMKSQTGICTFGGDLVISYAKRAATSSIPTGIGYKSPLMIMSEKGAMSSVSEVDDREWECKWDESKQQQKSLIRRWLCL